MFCRNTMSPLNYTREHVNGMFTAFALYVVSCYACIPGLNTGASMMILLGLMVVSASVDQILVRRRGRNRLNLLVAETFPLALHLLLIHSGSSRNLVLPWLGAAVVLGLLYIGLCTLCPIREPGRYSLRSFLSTAFSGCRALSGLCLGAMVAVFIFCGLFGLSVPGAKAQAAPAGRITIEENMDTLLLFEETTWETLSADERLSAMTTMVSVEAARLGIPDTISVTTTNQDPEMGACYQDHTQTITVNRLYLESYSGQYALTIVCHETYHAYQHRLVELYREADTLQQQMPVFEKARQYALEFENYITIAEDPQGYEQQQCEEDADNYAHIAAMDYLSLIQQAAYSG